MNRFDRRARVNVTVIVGVAAAMLLVRFERAHGSSNVSPAPTPVQMSQPRTGYAPPDYRAIVAQNKPAVVGITSEQEVRVQAQDWAGERGPFDAGTPNNDPFFQFFRSLPIPRDSFRSRALGSGFIISPEGLILTNAHVVRDAKRVDVTLSDRREFKAIVLGSDPITDIAVLKIDARALPTVSLGNSDALQVGDPVLAIGQPYGFEESATAGIVSAKGRTLPGESVVPFIQTDVAVNPGNSGGPLFNAQGKVVGINAQIYSTTGGYQGLSFAIPINMAVGIKDQIVRNGKVEHARLGVEVQTMTPELAHSFKRSQPDGALVARVTPESAAAQAGVKTGDIILALNGRPIEEAGDLSAMVGEATPGDRVQLQVWHDGQSHQLSATLQNSASQGDRMVKDVSSDGAPPRLGLDARALTPEERRQAGITTGLLVTEASGHAADAGIEAGDIIMSVDGVRVASDAQMRSMMAHHNQVALLVQRGDERMYLSVPLG